MDIKIIPDEKASYYYPLNKEVVLIVNKQYNGHAAYSTTINRIILTI